MLPLTADAFFAVVARCHAAVWPAPIALKPVALAIVVLMFRGAAASGAGWPGCWHCCGPGWRWLGVLRSRHTPLGQPKTTTLSIMAGWKER